MTWWSWNFSEIKMKDKPSEFFFNAFSYRKYFFLHDKLHHTFSCVMTSWPPARRTNRRLDWSRFSSEGQELLKNLSSVIVLEWNRPVQYTQRLCACGCVCQREREKEGESKIVCFFFFLIVVLVNVSSCHIFFQSAITQKVMLSFTQLLVKQTKYNASCHYCSDTHLIFFVSLSLTPFYFPSLSALSLLFFPHIIVSSAASLMTLSWKIEVAPLIVVVKVTLSAFKPFNQSVVMSLNTVSLVCE